MPLVHLVLIKVKDSIINDATAFADFKAQLETLKDLAVTKKTVKELKWGPPEYPARSQGLNWGLYSVFETREAYEEYANDEEHKNFSKGKILPNTDNFLAYDFEI